MRQRHAQPIFPLRAVLAAAAFALLLLVQSPPIAIASTSPVVYHSPSDDGARPAMPLTVAPGPNATLHLYMEESDGSSDASPLDLVCGGGSGDERCGWHLTIDASGGVDFVAFTPSGDVIANLTTGAQPELRFTGGNAAAGELGPVKLGDLEISTSGDGEVDLFAGTVVDSARQKVTLAPATVIYVPEPGQLLMLISGASLLGVLQHWRERRRGGRC